MQEAKDIVDELLLVHGGKTPFTIAGRKAPTNHKEALQNLMQEVSQ
jgi:hypothetical protein